jgi:5''-nucleotidase/2'',3''-cyclic phosphodiesterase and related esterases
MIDRNLMKQTKYLIGIIFFVFTLNACAKKQYVIKNVDGFLVEMNNTYDDRDGAKMSSFVQSYKIKLDERMNTTVGEAAKSLTKTGSQSILANFTADAMQEYATEIWGPIDFAIINNGGLRTTINQGPIAISNLYEVYVFENTLVLVDLKGNAVKELFAGFARNKMEGFSKSIRLVLKDKAIESITIGGKPLDENATYKIATVDYLAEGNDSMEAFKQAAGYTNSNIILRDAMIEYVKKLTSENILIDANMDERLDVKE